MLSTVQDRRAALKGRHRAALVTAARELLDERGGAGFTTEDLAARADVSRRTVFNHFSHLEDVVVACVEAELETAIAAVEEDLAASVVRASPLDDLEATLGTSEVATVLSWLGRTLSAPGRETAAERVRQRAMHRFGAGAAERLAERYPGTSPLELALLTTTVMNGMAVVGEAWLEETGGTLDERSRRRWADLLDLLFSAVRHGFAPRAADPSPVSSTPSTPPTSPTEGS
ncbi:TetR/AcrR family transcriptional regulator [Quadrisphaera setariae]|uniref:TetR/AcrR family transcriptional regulator n=1 Tax=Quadrisphaera setariae TaxID=2593304 RepID=A0A5C8ZIZ6_9ACTN|nr:TetR/AcrR family transcriptional regulator [Quadrisphaera setariae]TXR58035.1 TetR/AcrR family transcriptional regulator [Quadrisphaera setariae]